MRCDPVPDAVRAGLTHPTPPCRQVLGLHVSVEKALAGCFVAAVVVAVLAVVRALNLILAVVPNTIKLATARRALRAASPHASA